MQQKSLTVSHGWHNPKDRTGKDKLYRVEKVVGSVEIDPLSFLTRKEVEALAASSLWKVTVLPQKER